MKIHKNKKVYIIEPLEHGNGGCYGSNILDFVSLSNALKINPMKHYDLHDYWGRNFYPRICKTRDMNDEIYIWDEYDHKWEEQ